MVVKINIEKLASELYAYISNEKRQILKDEIATEEILKKMNGREVAFFHADMTKDEVLQIGEEALNVNW